MDKLEYTSFKLGGQTGELLEKISKHWLIGIRESNPAILTMFRDRNIVPYRPFLSWSGEFAGKYLTSAAYVYEAIRDVELYTYATEFADELINYQQDGYLGCFPDECRLSGYATPNDTQTSTWDSWGHYHIAYGLLRWYEITKKDSYIYAVEQIADLYIKTFYNGKPTILSIGFPEMNLAVYHLFGLLYRLTKKQKYLDFAFLIEKDVESEGAGRYLSYALEGYEYYQCPKPRWESMHIIMGYLEMYRNTGSQQYLDATKKIFYSILKTDVHNTGAFSTDEAAIGTPYKEGSIETCCVIAYNALAVELYYITGDIKILDFLEISHYNAIMGNNSVSGRWCTYDTPMDGEKCASFQSIGFQCRPGSPMLNCCSVNAPRGVATPREWCLTEENGVLYVNSYEAMKANLCDGLSITIKGNYPAENKVTILFDTIVKKRKTAFRIPVWSKQTTVTINGKVYSPPANSYFYAEVDGTTEVIIEFDFSAKILTHENKASIYIGPVLYGFDACDNPNIRIDAIPELSFSELKNSIPVSSEKGIMLVTASGIVLKDFYHLGQDGSSYKSWLPWKN